MKLDGDAIGLTEDLSALRRWTVTGPEMCRLVQEFEGKSVVGKKKVTMSKTDLHRSHSLKMWKDLAHFLDEMGNLFDDNSTDLIVLDTKEIVDPKVAKTLQKLLALGTEQFLKFAEQIAH